MFMGSSATVAAPDVEEAEAGASSTVTGGVFQTF